MKGSALDFLEYPCQFPLKVVGKNQVNFESIIVPLVQQHLVEKTDIKITANPSKKKTFISITLTFEAQSRTQLEAIYTALYECDDVIMTL